MLTVGRKLDIAYGEPYVQTYHQSSKCSPEELLPLIGRHQADTLPIGEFFHPVIFTMQFGKQTGGLGTIGDTGLY